MNILNNAVVSHKVRRPTFSDLHAKLAELESMMRAGYKVESLEVLNVAAGMLRNIESQCERRAIDGVFLSIEH